MYSRAPLIKTPNEKKGSVLVLVSYLLYKNDYNFTISHKCVHLQKIFNPQHACAARVTVIRLCVCVCVCVCV